MNFERFNFERFKKTIDTWTNNILVLRSEEERMKFKKCLEENNIVFCNEEYLEANSSFKLGVFSTKAVDVCPREDYKLFYIEDFIDFVSDENDVMNFLKEI